jgi:hypothetical protein
MFDLTDIYKAMVDGQCCRLGCARLKGQGGRAPTILHDYRSRKLTTLALSLSDKLVYNALAACLWR